MDITEVKIFLKEGQDKKLKAYATITFDNMFVVRNVKVIEGTKGLFVAMPSRKLKEPCPKCNFRNSVRSKYCNNCGAALPMTEHKAPPAGAEGAARESEHKDIAHPITAECRDYIQKKVLEAYDKEKKHTSVPSSPSSASSSGTHSSRGQAKPAITMEDEDIEL
ncbi:MAG: septation protein SpoVG family protein [Candidatus Omnitrophica bacterium]|nr:septation protein SpoVG family protein [Candidatus Omnitrophota bacterium]